VCFYEIASAKQMYRIPIYGRKNADLTLLANFILNNVKNGGFPSGKIFMSYEGLKCYIRFVLMSRCRN